jgi:hypothetical protein
MKRLKDESQGQHANGRNGPADQYRASIGFLGHILRQGKDAATNHRCHY